MSQEKFPTMIMQKCEGLKKCIMGFVQVENLRIISYMKLLACAFWTVCGLAPLENLLQHLFKMKTAKNAGHN